MSVVTTTYLKSRFESGDFPDEQDFIDLIDTLAALPSENYNKYVALLTQSGSNPPVATVLGNTLGGTVVWSYSGVGSYVGTLAGAFTANKTVLFISTAPSGSVAVFVFGRISNNAIQIESYDSAATMNPADDVLTSVAIEIRVYP